MEREDLEGAASILAEEVARQLRTVASEVETEADFRHRAATIFEKAGASANLNFISRDEYMLASGRADAVYNRLVLEYKRPGVLKADAKAKANTDALKQVKGYIEDIAQKEKREAHRLAGVVTDGHYMLFIRKVGEGWSDPEVMVVNSASVERYLRLLFALHTGAALIPENLVKDFGPGKLTTQRAVRAFHNTIQSFDGAKLPAKLYKQWQEFFTEATDYENWAQRIEQKDEFRKFIADMGIRREEAKPRPVFFAIHTYYALLVKLIAAMAAARFATGSINPLRELSGKEGDELLAKLKELEHGGIFKQYGIRNFLEGDFFRWYLHSWNADIEQAVRELIVKLSEYDAGSLELAPENARDLLKKLYHGLLPRAIRHDLGEYYTPDWLAERLIRMTLGEADLGNARKKVLDPSCGSGTFLVLLIKHIRERAKRNNRGDKETLDLILQNVLGIDLNPLAVIAARTNYIIALGDLLQYRQGEIDIPVYQADSIMPPRQGQQLSNGRQARIDELGRVPLQTAVGRFDIPAVFASRERLDILTNHLEDAVDSGIGDAAFYKHIKHHADLDIEELSTCENDLRKLYIDMHNLHTDDLNGVWTRIIKNQFAPLWIEPDPCDYIIGNPPWVNWENLPDQYRDRTVPLWHYYGMKPEGGIDSMMGKVKMDISMLMTYVVVDKYLKPRGRLGFVLSQSLFKSASAGKAFRRFTLPDKTQFGPMVVDDMTELQPFEGATNRTVVAVFVKGNKVSYPVPYSYWVKSKSGRGSAIGFDTPYEDVTTAMATFRRWVAEPVDAVDLCTAWLTARPKAVKAMRRLIGNSDYSAHAGAYTGGANAVYWVEVTGKRPDGLVLVSNITEGAKRKAENVNMAIEPDLLYPLLRGRDCQRWQATPSAHIICPRVVTGKCEVIPVAQMEATYRKTFAYFQHFRELLAKRKDAVLARTLKAGAPFYSFGAVGPHTFSPYKVVWKYIAEQMTCAVLKPDIDEHPTIPDHRLMLVPCSSAVEAGYLCAVLNSSISRLVVLSYAVSTQLSTHVLENISVPKYKPNDNLHKRLAELSEDAHAATVMNDVRKLASIESEIDQLAAQLWGLTDEELEEIQRSLAELSLSSNRRKLISSRKRKDENAD